MDKLLYLAPLKIDFSKPDGVGKKILIHIDTFSNFFEVSLLCSDGKSIILYDCISKHAEIITTGNTRNQILKSYKLIKNKYEKIYIRYPKSDPLFIDFLKKFKQSHSKIVLEIPTYPYSKEGINTIKGLFIKMIDTMYVRKLKKYVDRIVTFSDDEFIFGIKTIKTINGFDYKTIRSNTINSNNEIHLIAVSSMYIVNGFERIIKGLAEYEGEPSNKIVFDIVGNGPTLRQYKEMVQKYNLQDIVIFHGKLFGKDLNDIYKRANIGINSLAIHRQSLKQESTLKTREYVAYGLPIISSSYVDAIDEIANNNFVMRVPPTDEKIDISSIVDFYNNLISKYGCNLNRFIRENGEKTSDINITLKSIIDFLSNKRESSDEEY